MLAYVRGKVMEKSPTRVVLDVNGVGYEIFVPVTTYERVPAVGQEVLLHTYLHVREDVMQLYGFCEPEEKEIFEKLISVSGVGPRLAQGILSKISADRLRQVIAGGDAALLAQIPGIGRKTAQRLVTELRDKVGGPQPVEEWITTADTSAAEEAVLALISLGYKRNEAYKMVRRALNEAGKDADLETIIKKALQVAA
jgi:Holliday junction DNA helicase RuvA